MGACWSTARWGGAAAEATGALPERMLRLEFTHEAEPVAAWLTQQSSLKTEANEDCQKKVRIMRIDRHTLDIGLQGDAHAQAELVSACVAAGHRLSVIAPVTENLQQSYLKSLEAERALPRSNHRKTQQ